MVLNGTIWTRYFGCPHTCTCTRHNCIWYQMVLNGTKWASYFACPPPKKFEIVLVPNGTKWYLKYGHDPRPTPTHAMVPHDTRKQNMSLQSG